MSDIQDVRNMLAAAERAATSGDLASADELLRGTARIQEAELGALHPDLANTLNNLAIVAEKRGQLGDAETFYRRAVEIASASLPADDPMVAASRQNLEDFCRAQGLPIDRQAVIVRPRPSPPAPRLAWRPLAMVVTGVAILVAAALLGMRLRSTRDTSAPAPKVEPVAPQAAESTRPQQTVPAPVERPQPPKVDGTITLAIVQLCRTFSTSEPNWRCEPAGDSVAPGPIVLYTRVRSSRDTVVVHRWYRGEMLSQSVRLTVRASATEGYRTYSRQTVGAGEAWRVEVRSASGELLHEQRLAVR